MKRKLVATLLILLIAGFAFGQEELVAKKNIWRIADSLNALGKINRFDTTVCKVAESLNSCHPVGYFSAAAKLMKESKFNEAAFLYYLGVMRYRYFNSVNPEYQASGDGALFGAMKNLMGNLINMYQRVNVDNFISVLKRATNYTAENDYKYFSRDKNIEKYNDVTQHWNTFIIDFEVNKEKYSEQWKMERIEYEKSIDTMIEENKRNEESESQGK